MAVLQVIDDDPDAGVKSRFPGPGESDIVNVRIRSKIRIQFFDLVSPEFWPNLGSSGEPERLHPIRVLSSNDEICEAVA
jgi:hypothetical protein